MSAVEFITITNGRFRLSSIAKTFEPIKNNHLCVNWHSL